MSGSPEVDGDDDDHDDDNEDADDHNEDDDDHDDGNDGGGEDDLADSEVWFQGFSEAGRRSLVGAHLTEQRVHCFPVVMIRLMRMMILMMLSMMMRMMMTWDTIVLAMNHLSI